LYNIEKGTKTTDTDFHLSAHYDGSVNMAIGYGLDLYVNDWATVKKYLDEANEKSDSDFDFEKTYELSDEVSYTFETITKKYRTDFAALSGKLKLLSNPRLDQPFLSIDTTFSMFFMIERLGEAMPNFFDSPPAGFPLFVTFSRPLSPLMLFPQAVTAKRGKRNTLPNPHLDQPFLSIDTTFSMFFMIERLGEAMPFFFDSPQAGFLPFCRNQSAPLSSDAFSASWLSKEGQAEHASKSPS
jgi:hypothetical protein